MFRKFSNMLVQRDTSTDVFTVSSDNHFMFYGDYSTSSLIHESISSSQKRKRLYKIGKVSFMLVSSMVFVASVVLSLTMYVEHNYLKLYVGKLKINQTLIEQDLQNCTEDLSRHWDSVLELDKTQQFLSEIESLYGLCGLQKAHFQTLLSECRLDVQRFYLTKHPKVEIEKQGEECVKGDTNLQGSSFIGLDFDSDGTNHPIQGKIPVCLGSTELILWKEPLNKIPFSPEVIFLYDFVLVWERDNSPIIDITQALDSLGGNQKSERLANLNLNHLNKIRVYVDQDKGLIPKGVKVETNVDKTLKIDQDILILEQNECITSSSQRKIIQICIKGGGPLSSTCTWGLDQDIVVMESAMINGKVTLDRIRKTKRSSIKIQPKGDLMKRNTCLKFSYNKGVCAEVVRGKEKVLRCVYPVFYFNDLDDLGSAPVRQKFCDLYPSTILIKRDGTQTTQESVRHFNWLTGSMVVIISLDSMMIYFHPIAFPGAVIFNTRLDRSIFIMDFYYGIDFSNPMRAHIDLKEVNPNRVSVMKIDTDFLGPIFETYKTYCYPLDMLPFFVSLPGRVGFNLLVKRVGIFPSKLCRTQSYDIISLRPCDSFSDQQVWYSERVTIEIIKEDVAKIIKFKYCQVNHCEDGQTDNNNTYLVPASSVGPLAITCGSSGTYPHLKTVCLLEMVVMERNAGLYRVVTSSIFLG